jgi:hypothetical protein
MLVLSWRGSYIPDIISDWRKKEQQQLFSIQSLWDFNMKYKIELPCKAVYIENNISKIVVNKKVSTKSKITYFRSKHINNNNITLFNERYLFIFIINILRAVQTHMNFFI